MPRPLSKSRFKLAIECLTKLHYAKRENGYRNRHAGNDDEDRINQGGLAMTAWNFTQFTDINAQECESIRRALLKCCELDTLATIILVMGTFELRKRPLRLVC